MTIFKTFLKILNKNKGVVILYSAILIFFAGFNLQTQKQTNSFEKELPSIYIVNYDKEEGLTKSLIDYLKENSKMIELDEKEDALNDALFYRDVNTIITIPNHYGEDFLNGKNPELKIKCTKTYESELTKRMLKRFLNTANIYLPFLKDEEQYFSMIRETLDNEVELEMTTTLNTTQLNRISNYYNFANYSILAGCVYVICLILSSFKTESIRKRTIISSVNEKTYNRILLIANSLFAIVLWGFYCIISFILIGSSMFTKPGICCMLNSLLFTICSVSLAFLISNLITDKNAINGIVNVVALGSSFLCGAFVPTNLLPEFVQKIAHILPSYYFINNNERITSIENWNFEKLTPILKNSFMILFFTCFFIIISNYLTKKKRKILS